LKGCIDETRHVPTFQITDESKTITRIYCKRTDNMVLKMWKSSREGNTNNSIRNQITQYVCYYKQATHIP